jgi:hypothetical protein
MGELEGRLLKGWILLCADCHEPEEPPERPKAPCSICRGTGFDKMGNVCMCAGGDIDALLGMFGMKK